MTVFRYIAMSVLFLTAFSLSAQNRIEVSKSAQMLYVISQKGDTLLKCKVSTGKNPGNKQKKGDLRTPEGDFRITEIKDASSWTHDFGDGAGQRRGAYGPYFMRLATPPHTGIGIHGTCFPELLGTPSSEGCIRLHNDNLRALHKLVKVGTKVTVRP